MAVDWAGLVLGPCIAIFGEEPGNPILYQPAEAAAFTVNGIFDEAYASIDPLPIEGITPMQVSSTRPCLGVRLGDFLVQPEQGDLVTIRGTRFWVQEVHPDGKGGAKLLLNVEDGQR